MNSARKYVVAFRNLQVGRLGSGGLSCFKYCHFLEMQFDGKESMKRVP